MLHKFVYILYMLSLVITSCKKVHYFEDKNIVVADSIHFLAHRGGGKCKYGQNNINAVRYGLNHYDGVEVDVQISKNGTIWTGHRYAYTGCENLKIDCFGDVSDEDIEKLDSCKGPKEDFSKLEKVFKLMADSFPDKYISVDASSWKPCEYNIFDLYGELDLIGQGVINLKNKYHLKHVMIEAEIPSMLTYVKSRSDDIEVYITAYGDFEHGMEIALKKGLDGISYQYNSKEDLTANHIKLLHKKGLKIQIWTVNDSMLQNEAIRMKPDVIQTDYGFSNVIQLYKSGIKK